MGLRINYFSMDNVSTDEQIRDAILQTLHKAHRNPKGKYRNVTFSVLQKDVRDIATCEREDVLREVRYLVEKKLVKPHKERYAGYKIGNSKLPGGYTEYFALTSNAIDLLEQPSKYANMGYMLTRHTVKILKATDGYKTEQEYKADFQPETCFLPIDVEVEKDDKIQLLVNGVIKDEKIVDEVKKYYGSGPLDHIEVKWKKDHTGGGGYHINISNSPIHAPITQGTGNFIVTLTPSTDIDNILQLVKGKEGLGDSTKSELTSVIESELPTILGEADSVKTKSFLEKIKGYGQTWLVPIIAQVAATYIQHSLGINK